MILSYFRSIQYARRYRRGRACHHSWIGGAGPIVHMCGRRPRHRGRCWCSCGARNARGAAVAS